MTGTSTTKEGSLCRAGEEPPASEDAEISRRFKEAFERRLRLALGHAVLAELRHIEGRSGAV